MLAKQKRLNRTLFTNVFNKGLVKHTENFIVRFLPNTESNLTACSVVVSKKVIKTAVGRNRIRRLVYSAISPLLDITKNHLAIILFCKKGIECSTVDSIQKELTELLKTI